MSCVATRCGDDTIAVLRSRPAHLFLLLFQFFWLNVIIPGHTRGAVVLPGTKVTLHVAPCCAAKNDSAKSNAPSSNDRAHCAICFFAAHLTIPPTVDLRLASLGLLDVLPLPAPRSAISTTRIDPRRSRAPPLAWLV